MMQTDVSSVYVTTESVAVDARCRVKGVIVAPDGGEGEVVLTHKNTDILLTIPTTDSTIPFCVEVPGQGLLVEDKLTVNPGGCKVTVFYG